MFVGVNQKTRMLLVHQYLLTRMSPRLKTANLTTSRQVICLSLNSYIFVYNIHKGRLHFRGFLPCFTVVDQCSKNAEGS